MCNGAGVLGAWGCFLEHPQGAIDAVGADGVEHGAGGEGCGKDEEVGNLTTHGGSPGCA